MVPELLQDAATPQALADAVLQWIDIKAKEPTKIKALEERFTRLHAELQRDTAKLTIDAIEKILER